MSEFNDAQKRLREMLGYIVQSGGNLQVAKELEENEPAPQQHAHHWNPEAAVINRPKMEQANASNELDKQFSPDLFARGVNRQVRIDPEATPARPKINAKGQYTKAYDDDVDAGRYEAANPSNPVSATLVMPNDKNLAIVDIDLDANKANSEAFVNWLSEKIKAVPLESLWAAIPPLEKGGYFFHALKIESAVKSELAREALAPNQSAREESWATPEQLVDMAVFLVGSNEANDRHAIILFERLREQMEQAVKRIDTGGF